MSIYKTEQAPLACHNGCMSRLRHLWRNHHRVAVAMLVLVGWITTGTLFYWISEGFSLLDAFYQTIITIFTVGFGEVRPLDSSGRLFTAALILGGTSTGLYAAATIAERLVEIRLLNSRKDPMISKAQTLSGHVVICGYGRVGTRVAGILSAKRPVVLIDTDPERVEEAASDGLIALHGDAATEDTLHEANIEKAAVLVTALPSEAESLYIVMMAKELSPSIRIVCRSHSPAGTRRLQRAGAEQVVDLEEIAATRLATYAHSPAATKLLDTVRPASDHGFHATEIAIAPSSQLAGRTLAESQIRSKTGALILGIVTATGDLVANPNPTTVIGIGDTFVAIGEPEQLEILRGLSS